MKRPLAIGTLFLHTTLVSFDTAHFFRPPFFYGEPRFAWEGLSTGSLQLGGTSTSSAMDPCGRVTPLQTVIPCAQGTFQLVELVLDWYQNFTRGFFMHINIPTRFARYKSHKLLSWQHGGDPGVALGWTTHYEATEILDFIDGSAQIGCTIPTTPACNSLQIPLGYAGHMGVFGILDSSLGIFDWLTWGTHLTTIGFVHSPCSINKHKNPIIEVGTFLKADHFIRGLSITLGYEYQQELRHWSMHSFQTLIDYDYATDKHPAAPSVGILLSQTITGKCILRSVLSGLTCAVSIAWAY